MKKMKFYFTHSQQRLVFYRLLAVLAFGFCWTTNAMAQMRVSGKVTDETQKPLSGVSVIVKGTANGTTTDANGDFAIAVPGSSSTLVFSYVGYSTQEQPVGSNNTVNISLVPSTQTNLREIVVVGYGTQRKVDVTGSVTQVKGEEVAKQPA
ncbi:MAG TPA: carboxypeptidase-like regulatory domain-containing protein, partial [Flavisolibacter sp.]|nr:carboxypeptidase-like regulatory domain-containing protein [Flavisolibacter sp.]